MCFDCRLANINWHHTYTTPTVEPFYSGQRPPLIGDQHFGHYTEVAFIEGLFCTQTVHLGPGYLTVISQLAFIQGWPLRGVPLYNCTVRVAAVQEGETHIPPDSTHSCFR